MLTGKLNELPKTSERIFRNQIRQPVSTNFLRQRKRIVYNLENPRLNKITFNTFRHWRATIEYTKTTDILHVMQLLGHRNIKSTLICTQLIKFEKRMSSTQPPLRRLKKRNNSWKMDLNMSAPLQKNNIIQKTKTKQPFTLSQHTDSN